MSPTQVKPTLLPFVADQPLVDHHCHGVLSSGGDLEALLNEADGAAARGMAFDSLAGLAFLRWCPPLLGLAPHTALAQYALRRRELGGTEVNQRFLAAANVSALLVDTGYRLGPLLSPAETALLAGATGHEIVRLERLAEDLGENGVRPADFPHAYRSALAECLDPELRFPAVGFKSVAAYRVGLALDGRRPSDAEVVAAAERWLGGAGDRNALGPGAPGRNPPRLAEEVLHRFFVWSAADLGRPIQFHVGYGDRDADLHLCNPLLLTELIRALEPTGTPVMLLHNYPYHREAGYLAQVFPNVHVDLGLATHNIGSRAPQVLAEALELVPLRKFLFSSDAFGLPELYYLGALLFRQGLSAFLRPRLDAGDISRADAERITRQVGAENASRVYGLARLPDGGQPPGNPSDAAGRGDRLGGGLAGRGGGDASPLEVGDVDIGCRRGAGGRVQRGQVGRPHLVVDQDLVQLGLQVGGRVSGHEPGGQRGPADQAAAARAHRLRVALGLLVDVARDAGRRVAAVAVGEEEAHDRGDVRRERAARRGAAQPGGPRGLARGRRRAWPRRRAGGRGGARGQGRPASCPGCRLLAGRLRRSGVRRGPYPRRRGGHDAADLGAGGLEHGRVGGRGGLSAATARAASRVGREGLHGGHRGWRVVPASRQGEGGRPRYERRGSHGDGDGLAGPQAGRLPPGGHVPPGVVPGFPLPATAATPGARA